MTETVVVKGEVTRGATVTVRGQQAQVLKGKFRETLNLRVGENRFTVVARQADRRTVQERLRFVRKLPPPPIVAPTPRPAVPATPAVPPASGYPAPGQCGVDPATGDQICTEREESPADAPGASNPPPTGGGGGGESADLPSCAAGPPPCRASGGKVVEP